MNWPQIVIIALAATSVGINLAKHGQPREGKYSFWISLTVCAAEMWVLRSGGFFG